MDAITLFMTATHIMFIFPSSGKSKDFVLQLQLFSGEKKQEEVVNIKNQPFPNLKTIDEQVSQSKIMSI